MAAKKGVTLVELIIVVIIIGIMTMVSVPRMALSLVTIGKAQTAAHKIAAAIRFTRSLAIADANNNQQGFTINMTGGGSYTGYQVVNIKTSEVMETGSIDSAVSCTGANDFTFGPLGNRLTDSDNLTVSGGGKTYIISVVSATGMIKCEKQ